MPNFQESWSKPVTPSFGEKVNDALRPQGSLKPRIQVAIKSVHIQTKKLDGMLSNLQKRDDNLFRKIVEAVQKHDVHASKVLGNELAELRKVTKVLGSVRIALERIELRLSTCSDIGDVITTIMPTVSLMKNLKMSLGKVMPGAEQEISQMAEMLGSFMTDSLSDDSAFGMDSTTSEESENILKEAAAVAASSTGQMFPSAPSGLQQDSVSSSQFDQQY